MSKKYLDLAGLSSYDQKIKEYIDDGDVTIDSTLTQAGQAADAKKVGDEISDVKSAIVNYTELPNSWRQGSYNFTSGESGDNSKMISSQRYVLFPDTISAYCDTGYEFAVLLYDDSDVYQGVILTDGTYAPYESGMTIQYFTQFDFGRFKQFKYRICMLTTPTRQNITPADSVHFHYGKNDISYISADVSDNSDILLDSMLWDNRGTWFSNGQINYNTGIPGASSNKARVHTNIYAKYPDVMYLKATGVYEFSVLLYDDNDVYQGTVNNAGGYSIGTDVCWFKEFNLARFKQFNYKVNIRNAESITSNIDRTDLLANFHYGSNKKHDINILFIGNSLTQDGIAYLPYVLRNYYPDISFHMYMWYKGGYDLSQQYNTFSTGGKADIMSYCENDSAWINLSNSRTIDSVLQYYKIDIVCMQEYFNHKTTYTETDLADWNNCKTYILSHYQLDNPLEFISLFHAPKRSDTDTVFDLTKSGNGLILQKTISEDMIPTGIAVYRALSTALDNLGDEGHLSPDGTHTQEGLPCLLQTYAALLWLFDKFGINKSIYGCSMRMTTDIYNSINVPGPNLGSGVITGTDAENLLAQEVAIQAYKEGKQFVINNLFHA